MNFLEKIELLKRMDYFIRCKGTNTPQRFARRLRLSIPTMYRNLELLKAKGAKIGYDNDRPSYFYEEPFDLIF